MRSARLALAFAALAVAAGTLGLAATPAPAASASAPEPPLVDKAVMGVLARNSAPAVGDVDGDGVDDLAVGAEDGFLRIYRGGDLDDLLWARPAVPHVQPFCHAQGTATAIDSTPVIADIDDDGANEIVVGMTSTYVANQNGGLIAFERDGSVKWRWTYANDLFNVWNPHVGATPDGWCEGIYATPAIGDVNGDGHTDVVFGGWDHFVHALDGRNGVNLPGFPFDNVDTIWSSPALYDVDADGRDEIFIGGDDTPGIPGHFAGGQFHALDWTPEGLRILWKQHPGEVLMGSVAVGDTNGDGRAEVFITTGLFYNTADTRRVLAYHADDGSVVPGWPRETAAPVTGSPALGDVDGDGLLDVVVGSWDHSVYAWKGTGAPIWSTRLCCNPAADSLNRVVGHPIIADLDGDGDNDVAVGSAWSIHLLDGRTGNRFAEVSIGLSNDSSPAVLDAGTGQRLLVTNGYALGVGSSTLQTYRLPDSPGTDAWPQFRGAGSGRPAAPPCPAARLRGATGPVITGDGYWMLGQRGAVYAFGDVADHGDPAGALATAVGVAAVDIEPSPTNRGYWVLDSRGCVHNFGDAEHHGNVDPGLLRSGESAAALSATDDGYFVFTDIGRTIAFGDAVDRGDMVGTPLNGPVLGSSATPSNDGYYMVGSDGGIFAFGDAAFRGSMGGHPLNQPVVGIAPDPDNDGYWLVAGDGGIFAFGAPFRGSMGGQTLNRPVVGAIAYGNGYLMVASDGGVFNFSDKEFRGSLGSNPPDAPIASIAALD